MQEPKILNSELLLAIIQRAWLLMDRESNVLNLKGHVVVRYVGSEGIEILIIGAQWVRWMGADM